MIRKTLMAALLALTASLNVNADEIRQVMPPQAGTADRDIPAHYSPNGVNNLRMTSSISRKSDGSETIGTVWYWDDDRGANYKLSRTKTQVPGGPIGSLGTYTLQRTTPRPEPKPVIEDNAAHEVRPPQAGTPDKDIPAHYSPNGVRNLRIASSAGVNSQGHEIIGTVWSWQDDKGILFKLTRRLTIIPGGPVGSLGKYTLEKSSPPAPKPEPTPAPDNGMKVPPAGTPNNKIPEFYTENGVRNLRMSSNQSRKQDGSTVTETTWKWDDNSAVSYTLTRVTTDRNGESFSRYSLSRVR